MVDVWPLSYMHAAFMDVVLPTEEDRRKEHDDQPIRGRKPALSGPG
jgi:hypothetical protein